MKPNGFAKIPGQFRALRSLRLALAAPALVFTFATSHAETPKTNWVNFTIGGAFVSDNDAGMKRRTQTNGDFYGGVDSMLYSKAINDSTTLTLDGHLLPGLEDYEFNLDLTKSELGYIKAGYKQYRTWYDGSGGFVPGAAGGWIPSSGDDELSLDRGNLWFEAGLRKEKLPKVTFGYSHEWRNGEKDSSSWGLSGTLTPPGASYAIVPTLLSIDEVSDTFTLDATHTLGKTDLGLGLRYESVRYEDSMNVSINPVLPASTHQSHVNDTDLFSGSLTSETRFNDRMLLSCGYAYSTMSSDIDGSSRSSTLGAISTFLSDLGGGSLSSNTINVNFWWNPIPDLVIVPSLLATWEDSDADSFTTRTGALLQSSANDSSFDQLAEQLEVRYTGVENLVLYSKLDFSQDDASDSLASDKGDIRVQSSDISQQKFVLGANWYPLSGLSVSTQYYHTNFNQDYDNWYNPAAGTSFDAQLETHGYDTDDLNVRVTWRALPNLTLVSRYDYQQTTIENQAYLNNPGVPQVLTSKIDSADITRNIFSESLTWSPVKRAYVQGTFSYVFGQTDTPADTNGPSYIADSDSDYFTGSLTAGYAIDDKTSVTGNLTYYGASNYSGVGGAGAVGYGLNTDEFGLSLTLTRMITENMIWNLRYGYINSNTDSPDQTGGYNDFSAHLVSTGLQIHF
jgi:hypothetical protein